MFFANFFLVFIIIFRFRFYVRRTEKVEFFIAAYGLKQDFSDEIVKQFKDDGLVENNIYFYSEDDPNIFNYFSANGENADYVVFSETNVKDMKDYVPYNYVATNTLLSDIPSISKYDLYEIEGTSYAIKIYDGTNQEYNNKYSFTDYIEFNKEGKGSESYYLLIDNGSPNFDKDNNHTLGISVLEYLLNKMVN